MPRCSVDGHALLIDQLKGTTPTESIDFSYEGLGEYLGEKLGVPSAVVIAACIAGNEHLKQLKCAAAERCAESAITPAIPLLAFKLD